MTTKRKVDPEAAKNRALRQVTWMAGRAEKATASKHASIRFAADAGASLRELAEASGLSHMTIKRLLERSTADDGPCG